MYTVGSLGRQRLVALPLPSSSMTSFQGSTKREIVASMQHHDSTSHRHLSHHLPATTAYYCHQSLPIHLHRHSEARQDLFLNKGKGFDDQSGDSGDQGTWEVAGADIGSYGKQLFSHKAWQHQAEQRDLGGSWGCCTSSSAPKLGCQGEKACPPPSNKETASELSREEDRECALKDICSSSCSTCKAKLR